MLKPDIPYSFTRLHKRLPLHDASRIAYAKSKFNWMACDFTEELFDDAEPCFSLGIIDKIFNTISVYENRFGINTVDKLIVQVASLYLETMKQGNAKLLVSEEFFCQQFVMNFKMRYRDIDDIIGKFYHVFLKKLKTHHVEDPETVLGTALDKIDEKMSHPLNETRFISDWLLNVVTICQHNGLRIDLGKFMIQ
jgi:hypothetical protein